MRRLLIPVLLLLPLVAGCSETSFIGRQFDDFTAYYNKFYNAQDLFEEEMRKLEDRTSDIDRTRYLPIFPRPDQAANQQLQATITKSADVLRNHPNSRWVDDALLLIGKSYFFQQNYVGAQQKFREVIDLNTKLEDEARFWLGRTLAANDAYAEAVEHIETSLMQEDELSARWAARLHLVRGDLAVRQESWEEAASEIEKGLEEVKDNDVAARAQFTLGQVYETLGRYADAAEAYDRVNDYRPVFELSYAAKLSQVRVEGLYGDADRAFALLRSMERDDKYYEDRAELAYQRGRIYQRQGRADDAFIAFDELLYASDADISSVRGATHYALGELLRDDYLDFTRAAAHFDTAATALRTQQEDEVLYAPAAITDSREVADVFKSFAAAMGRIEEADSLLRLGRMDRETFDAFVMELRRKKAEELEEQREEQERALSQRRFNNAQGMNQQRGAARGENSSAASQSAGSESGFLYHRSTQRVREAQRGFVERWGRRPHVPNWRRMQAVTAIVEERGGASEAEAELELIADAGEELPEVDVSAVPRDSSSFAEVESRRAMARYELANVLFIQMNEPDSAAAWYRRVVQEDQDEPVASRALFALAEVQRALGDSVAARRLQRDVIARYPDTELADRLREQLDGAAAAAPDTTALAEAAYGKAYERWREEDYDTALEQMVEVAARYENTDVAPRALLAAGSIALERARRDSADVLAPIDLALPDSMLIALGIVDPPAPVVVDTLAADSMATTATSLAATDSVAADSLGAGRAVSDSLAGAPMSPAPDSSVASAPDSTGADSLAMEAEAGAEIRSTEPPHPKPARFFAVVTERYPEAPQRERAERILGVLREREQAVQAYADSVAAAQQAYADSVAAAEAGVAPASLPADSVAQEADSLVQVVDSTAQVPDTPPVPPSSVAADSTVTDSTTGRLRRPSADPVQQDESGGQAVDDKIRTTPRREPEPRRRGTPVDSTNALPPGSRHHR